jgi:hypothetical protein
MPINEASGKPRRERWPAQFDIEGVPRDTATRQQLLDQIQQQQTQQSNAEFEDFMSPVTPTRNHFSVDGPTTDGPVITDINNPPKKNYNPRAAENEFPKMLYHHESGRVLKVENEKEQKAAIKRGFELKPSQDFDYGKINRAGIAAKASTEPKREDEMSAEELAALDEADQAS